MAYSWQFQIMEFSGQPLHPVKHPAEAKYVVRQEINRSLATILTLTDALNSKFVPDDVKHAIRTVMSCYKFNRAES